MQGRRISNTQNVSGSISPTITTLLLSNSASVTTTTSATATRTDTMTTTPSDYVTHTASSNATRTLRSSATMTSSQSTTISLTFTLTVATNTNSNSSEFPSATASFTNTSHKSPSVTASIKSPTVTQTLSPSRSPTRSRNNISVSSSNTHELHVTPTLSKVNISVTGTSTQSLSKHSNTLSNSLSTSPTNTVTMRTPSRSSNRTTMTMSLNTSATHPTDTITATWSLSLTVSRSKKSSTSSLSRTVSQSRRTLSRSAGTLSYSATTPTPSVPTHTKQTSSKTKTGGSNSTAPSKTLYITGQHNSTRSISPTRGTRTNSTRMSATKSPVPSGASHSISKTETPSASPTLTLTSVSASPSIPLNVTATPRLLQSLSISSSKSAASATRTSRTSSPSVSSSPSSTPTVPPRRRSTTTPSLQNHTKTQLPPENPQISNDGIETYAPATPMPATAKAGAVVLTSATAATVLLSASAIGTATMQAALSQSTCRKTSSSNAPPPTPEDNPTLYLISPFFGDSAAMVLGNMGIVLAAFGLHLFVAMIVSVVAPYHHDDDASESQTIQVHTTNSAADSSQQQQPAAVVAGGGSTSTTSRRHMRRVHAFTMTRFPHFSLIMAQMCVQGVQMGGWQLIFDAINGRPEKFSSFGTRTSLAANSAACALLGVVGLMCSVVPTICAVKLRGFLLTGSRDDVFLHHRQQAGEKLTGYSDPSAPPAAAAITNIAEEDIDAHSSTSSSSTSHAWAYIGQWLGIDAPVILVPLRLMPESAKCFVVLLKHAGPTHVWHPPEYLKRFGTVFNAFSRVRVLGPWLLAENWFVSLLVTLVSSADPPSAQFIVCNGLMFFCALILLLHLIAVMWLKPFRLPYKNPLKAVCIFFLSVGCALSAPVLADYSAVQSAQAVNDMLQAIAVMTLGVYEIMIMVAVERSRVPDDDESLKEAAASSLNALPLSEVGERSLNLSDVIKSGRSNNNRRVVVDDSEFDDEEEMLRIAASISLHQHQHQLNDNEGGGVSPPSSLVRVSSRSALFSSAAQLTPASVIPGSQKEISLDSHLHLLAAVARRVDAEHEETPNNNNLNGHLVQKASFSSASDHGGGGSRPSKSPNRSALSSPNSAFVPSFVKVPAASTSTSSMTGAAGSYPLPSAAPPPQRPPPITHQNSVASPRVQHNGNATVNNKPAAAPPPVAVQRAGTTGNKSAMPIERRAAAAFSSSDDDDDDRPPPPVVDTFTSSDDDL